MASSYVGRSKLFRARSHNSTNRRGGTAKAIFYNNYSHNLDAQTPDSNIKVYIPKEYFKHTGYIKDEEDGKMQSRQQPRKPQTPFKERFNEKLEYPGAPSQKSGKQMINNQAARIRHVGGPGAGGDDSVSVLSKMVSQVDDTRSKAASSEVLSYHTGVSRPQTASVMKRKILERINQLDEKELSKIGRDLDVKPEDARAYANNASSIGNDDKASIITQDRLRKFNEIYGYEHGPAAMQLGEGNEEEENAEQDQQPIDEQSNPNEGLEEIKDEVHGLNEQLNAIAKKAARRIAKIKPKLMRQSHTPSRRSDE